MKNCPKCNSENIYQDMNLWICPECSYEWLPDQMASKNGPANEDTQAIDINSHLVLDSNGNILLDGDSVVVLKDLKIKGSSSSVKGGTKIRNIKLFDAGDGHNISCKIEGMGSINLKSEFVRKA